MAGHVDESSQFGSLSAPDRGNGPGSSTSYFSGVGEAWDSLASAAETDWNWTKSEASSLWTGTKEEAAHLYAEANKWGIALLGAKSWNELHHIANVILGPESFYLGLACGVVENLGEMAWGVVDLVKTLVLAGLYEKLHGPMGFDAIEPSSMMLRFATPVFDKILGKPMREAEKKVRGMIIGVGKIVKEPVKFLGTAWQSTKNDYVAKWHQYEQFYNSGRAIDKFRAGELAGDALTQIILTILAIVSGVGAAVRGVQLVVGGVRLTAAAVIELTGNLSREAPELLEIANGMKEAEGAASTAEAAAKAGQEAKTGAAKTSSSPKSAAAAENLGSDGLTAEQRAQYRKQIDNPPAGKTANDMRYERYQQKCANKGAEPLSRDQWNTSNDRLRNNAQTGSVDEANARQGLQNYIDHDPPLENNNAGTGVVQETVNVNGKDVTTRPDSIGRNADGDIDLVHDHKSLNGADPVAYDTDQMRAQRQLIQDPDGEHVVTLSRDGADLAGNPPTPRPSDPLAQKSTVYYTDSNGTVTQQWVRDPSASGGGYWSPVQ